MKNFIWAVALVVLTGCPCEAQNHPGELAKEAVGSFLQGPAESNAKVEAEGNLGTLDVDKITKRVDELTETANTHTAQIETLDKRVTALEDGIGDVPVSSVGSSTSSRPAVQLRSMLNPVGTVKEVRPRSWGSVSSVSSGGGGCTGNLSRSVFSNMSQPVVSYSEPVVTSVTVSEPVVVSQPQVVRYQSQPIVRQPSFVQSAPVRLSAPLPASPPPIERRQTVSMPVDRIVTEKVRYEPSQCPGGVCPVPRSPMRTQSNGFLGSSLRSRLGSRRSSF